MRDVRRRLLAASPRSLVALLVAVGVVPPAALSAVLVQVAAPAGSAGSWAVAAGLAWGAVAAAAAAAWRACSPARRRLDRRARVIAAAAATSHDWVWGSDAAGRLIYTNDAVTDLLGHRPADLIGGSCVDLLADDATRHTARANRSRSARTRGWDGVELTWRHQQGHDVALEGSGAPVRDRRGRIVGFAGTWRLVGDDRGPRAGVAAARQRVAGVLATAALDMALQPIVDLASGRVGGVEALARFHDGRSPQAWFADAHEAGRARELDELTFHAALGLLGSIPESVYLSVNASPELLMDAGFRARLTDSPLPLSRLVIEITEHARVADYGDLNAAVSPLRAHGVRFAIDDTGAGYASLSHVLQLKPDIIKMDRALIANLEADRARRSLVTALVLLALDVGATVTGEGVETDTQKETLTTLGVEQAQGYLLARPTTDRSRWQEWWTRTWLPPAAAAAPTPATGGR